MRATNRVVGALLGLSAVAVLVVVPLSGAGAQVQAGPSVQTAQAVQAGIHWGQSPYYPTCLEGPCRVVLIADKTANPAFEAQVQRWTEWMNFVRVYYDLKLPAFGYVGPRQGLLPDPSCAVAPGIISICRNNAIVDADCPGDPGVIRCSVFNYGVGDNHINWNRSSIRTTALDAADTWTVVCGALGRAIGMQPSGDANSCMSGNLTLGSGQERYYVTADWLALFSLYEHPAGS